MAATNITDELIGQIAEELAANHHLSPNQLSEVGRRVSPEEAERQAANDAFAERFMAEQAETFDRLSRQRFTAVLPDPLNPGQLFRCPTQP